LSRCSSNRPANRCIRHASWRTRGPRAKLNLRKCASHHLLFRHLREMSPTKSSGRRGLASLRQLPGPVLASIERCLLVRCT
jgi:hypothetical protein